VFGLFRRRNIKIPRREYEALIGASVGLAAHLEQVIDEARRGSTRTGEISPAEFENLIVRLGDISRETTARYREAVDASTATDNVVFDTTGHARCVAPAAVLLTAPGDVVKGAQVAIEGGTTNPSRLYDLAIAELDAALQRWRAAMSAVINTNALS
jgi:hypothetical protein